MEFILAVARNDLDKVRNMLQSGIDVNKSFIWNSKETYSPVIPADMLNRSNSLQKDQEYQCKPLNIAVMGGHANMVRLLLSAGADINNKDGRGRTAIVCAIYGLDLDASNINTSNLHIISQTNSNHLDILKNILLCHPNLYYATLDSPQNEIKGITPLCLASYLGKTDLVQALLEDGRVNVDGTDSKNATALMYAARDGNVSIVKILLGFHASPDFTDSHGWSAIQYAERFPKIVQLCEHALKMKRSELVTSNQCNIKYPINYSKLSHLLSSIPNYPSSLSHLQFGTIKDIDHLDPSASSLVHIIQSAFLQAIKIHDHLSIQTLLMQPPPIDAQSHGPILVNHHDPKTGLTALHHAMRTKPLPSTETIALLFQAGADINSQTYYGRTALHHLARFGLEKDGKSWGIQKTNRKDPQQPLSTISGDINVPEHLALCASMLIKFGALVNIADPTGNTPLHFAAEFGGVPEVLEVLVLEGGADLTLKNKKNLTPLDVCKSNDIKKKLLDLDSERKNRKTKSVMSSLAGTIRPFDSASEYNHRSIPSSVTLTTPSFLFRGKKEDADYQEDSDFETILRAFFSYQTTCTNSIEHSLAFLTDSILGSWHPDEYTTIMQQLEQTMSQLRLELREAHDMFDNTTQLVDKVITSFRDELEQVEQIHQADWELSELQHDKTEKLFDVFERIDGRFCQLELSQDDLISQIERLRKALARKLQQLKLEQRQRDPSEEDLTICVSHVVQSLCIIQKVPINNVRDDRQRLYQDMTIVIEKLMQQLQNKDNKWTHAKSAIEERWSTVKEILTKPVSNTEKPQISRSMSQPTALSPKQKTKLLPYNEPNQPSLSELELSFDILHSNLYEIERDMHEVTDQLEKLTESKKKMYELCLSLEKERASTTRSKEDIQSELNQVLAFTRQLFDKQDALEKEKSQLLKEFQEIEKKLESTRTSLYKVRPPALLQGLLDRLDTDETPRVIVEKDWKEDINLVTEVILDQRIEETDESSASSTSSLEEQPLGPLNTHCTLSALCYMTRLDTSLYCLKVLASNIISKSRQRLLQIQSTLQQANTDLDETRNQMSRLYEDAAEVARQLFALKTELETIVRHRKEEVVKVWEVVDEVSQGIDAKALQVKYKTASNTTEDSLMRQQHQQQQRDRVEEQDRHQWIVRELDQLKHVYENLQEAIEELKQEQGMIGQSLRQLATSFIEPQVNKLVGQDNESLLSVSDRLADLMECIKEDEFGLKPASSIKSLPDTEKQQRQQVTKTTGTGLRAKPNSNNAINRLSRLSAATNRLSISTYSSNRSSAYIRSSGLPSSNKRLSTAVSLRNDKKRMSVLSATSLSSLSSYQQERMLARASNLSNALVKVQQRKNIQDVV